MTARESIPAGLPRRVLLVELNEDGTTGGSHRALLDLVRGFDRRRVTPVVLFYQDNAFAARLRDEGVEVHVWAAERASERRTSRLARLPAMLAAIRRRRRLLRERRIDLVHCNNSPSFSFYDWLPAARLVGIPVVTHCRGELFPHLWPLQRRALAWFDAIVPISAYIERLLREAGAPASRLVRIDDGVDAARVRARVRRAPADVRDELRVPAGASLVVMAGHLRPWKGHAVVLRALGQLDAATRAGLVVAFAGDEDPYAPGHRATLDALVAEHTLAECVRFLGPREDVADLMSAADAVLHASTTAEPFGLVVVEALALGRPVIASALGGPGEILVPGTGATFDPGDPSALATHLRTVVDGRFVTTLDPRVMRERVEHYAIAHTVDAVQHLYDAVSAHGRPAAADVSPAARPGRAATMA